MKTRTLLKSLLSLSLMSLGLLSLSKGGWVLIALALVEAIDTFDPAANR